MPGARASTRAQNSPASVREMASRLAKSSDGLPLPQIVDEQVADRPALDAVAVDQLLDRQLPAGQAERADAVRRVAGEDTQGAQPQVEVDLLLPAAGVDPPHRLDQLDAVADGDVGDGAALAGQQRGDPGGRDLGVALGAGRFGVGQLAAAGRTRPGP